ncbi:MAG: hypothetical protein JO193_06900 [Candidatus Eremiobacteraeota bacterium]|nr:hypothetical protein [Candidatus Eremiobacteraeota bacterium]MBV9972260.1 hypothetical protein [Candidatus Eremiobacteraeota bacterium]
MYKELTISSGNVNAALREMNRLENIDYDLFSQNLGSATAAIIRRLFHSIILS